MAKQTNVSTTFIVAIIQNNSMAVSDGLLSVAFLSGRFSYEDVLKSLDLYSRKRQLHEQSSALARSGDCNDIAQLQSLEKEISSLKKDVESFVGHAERTYSSYLDNLTEEEYQAELQDEEAYYSK